MLVQGHSQAATARKLNIGVSTLRWWRSQASFDARFRQELNSHKATVAGRARTYLVAAVDEVGAIATGQREDARAADRIAATRVLAQLAGMESLSHEPGATTTVDVDVVAILGGLRTMIEEAERQAAESTGG